MSKDNRNHISNAIVIGASTGGPLALEKVLYGLPKDLDALVIVVQHLPAYFTTKMVKRMSKKTQMPFSEIEDKQILLNSHIYLVPGDDNFFIANNHQAFLHLGDKTLSPSIDMSITSVAEHFGPKTIGVILTGMGADGVMGAKAIKQVGGKVIVQDEASSTIYGMPKAVKEANLADEVLPLEKITARLLELIKYKK